MMRTVIATSLKRAATTGVLLFFFSTGLFAKPKEKVFNNSPQEIVQAALRSARERHVITYVHEKNLMHTFETGTSAFTYGFNANASVEQISDGMSKLLIKAQKKTTSQGSGIAFGAGDRTVDKFFQQVEEEPASQSQQKSAVKPETTWTRRLIPTPRAPANDGTGAVTVSSIPDGGDISVDDNSLATPPPL